MLTFVLGGARSGKSAFAEELGRRHVGPVTFVATCPRIDGDDDLADRVARHRADRPDGWTTIEEELDLAGAIDAAQRSFLIIDCLTLWIGNLQYHGGSAGDIDLASERAVEAVQRRAADTVVVSNEVGLGIVPADRTSRDYRDLFGSREPAVGRGRRPFPVARRRASASAPRPPRAAAMTWFHDALTDLPARDEAAADAVADRVDRLLRPAGALRRLDDIAIHVAGWHGDTAPTITRPAVLVFAADHGVARAGVSAFPGEVTAAMLAAVRAGRATINAMARAAGATLDVFDVGVGDPTGDIRTESALSPERMDRVAATAAAAVDAVVESGGDLLVVGELGIGNTTISAALPASLLGGDVADWVGRGTGVDDDGMRRKREVVTAALRRIARVTDPIEVMREIGGAELTAMAAAVLRARRHRLPVVLDGYVATAAVLPLHQAVPGVLDHCIVGHLSAEPGHRRILDHLGLEPLLDLQMRLGEGSGAMAAVPLVRMACVCVTEVPTFDEWFDGGGRVT